MNMKIYRKLDVKGKTLYIELGKYWEIQFSREFIAERQPIDWTKRIDEGWQKAQAGAFKLLSLKWFTKHIKDGHVIPSWYGYAYRDFETDSAVYMPIPFNLIRAGWRWFRHAVLYRIQVDWPRRMLKHELEIYRLGELDGFRMGRYNASVVRTAAEILRAEGLDVRYKE